MRRFSRAVDVFLIGVDVMVFDAVAFVCGIVFVICVWQVFKLAEEEGEKK